LKTIVIIGASGFIGVNLIHDLLKIKYFNLIATTRNISKAGNINNIKSKFFKLIEVDLSDQKSILKAIKPNCIVINLAYNWHEGKAYNLKLTNNLLEVCGQVGITRFLHISTAAVVGCTVSNLITEETKCNPVTEYGITKLLMERLVIEKSKGLFESQVIRPTSVFGPNGLPLKKLVKCLMSESFILNNVRSCLFGFRRMNLVNIKNLTASIIFLMRHKNKFYGEIYIVSEDHSKNNNFNAIEKILMKKLSIPYYQNHLILPSFFIKFSLWALGRNNISPDAIYSTRKIRKLGFKFPLRFTSGLKIYANSILRL
jgi:nucleoside-diphosphate-sugar epimerase